MTKWQDATIDTTSNPPMWFLWPVECPMLLEKVRAAKTSEDANPLSCMGGPVSPNTGEHEIFATCWHTTAGGAKKSGGVWCVECSYDPERDAWNHPGKWRGDPPPVAELPPPTILNMGDQT